MSIRIPAAQVPFVRKYFQIITDLAENAPAGQDLVLEKELFSALTNTQLEGFTKLIDSYSTLSNNERNKKATENSELLLKYYKDPVLKLFENKSDDEVRQLKNAIKEVCTAITSRGMYLEPEDFPLFFSLSDKMETIGYLSSAFSTVDPNVLQNLYRPLQEIVGKEPLTMEQCQEFAEFFQRVCELDYNEQNEYYKTINTHRNLTKASGLSSDNLQAVTNYMRFGEETSGGKRKRKTKTRKAGKR
jgi:hypothetical protein